MVFVWSDFNKVGESIEETMNALGARTQAINSLNLLRQDAAEAETMANKLKNALPSRDSLFLFAEEMNRLARERNLTPSFTFGNEIASQSPGSPNRVEFVMNVAGERQPVLSFLESFDSSRYFTRVKNLEFLSQGANTTAYQVILAGEVFFSE
ncbi:MAG: hypothetical protein WC519_03190 [Parcubacteria group bacterium]